ncbi:MAG: hypothetical protein AABZ08_09745 [Planctomycetota bacterium]
MTLNFPTRTDPSRELGFRIGSWRKGLESFSFATAAMCAMILFLSTFSQNVVADVYIRTIPNQTHWVADGTTEYRIDVVGNTTQHPAEGFTLAQWALWIPVDLSFVRAELPDESNNPSQNVDDFFYSNLMTDNPGGLFNWIYSIPSANANPSWPSKITGNVRETADSMQGPSNLNDKILGSFFFKANPNAAGTTWFRTSNETLLGTSNTSYTFSPNCSGNPGCLIKEYTNFSIIPVGDMDMNIFVDTDDVEPFVNALLDPVSYQAQRQAGTIGSGDMNLDGVLDGRDTDQFVSKLLGR